MIPQINLSTITNKTSNTKYHTELYRNIDYGIFTNDFQLLLLIELNDQTHNQSKRKYRDIKVREICKNANIPIMTFYTNYPNEESYVINRILKEIQPSSNNNDVSILEEKDKNNMVQEQEVNIISIIGSKIYNKIYSNYLIFTICIPLLLNKNNYHIYHNNK